MNALELTDYVDRFVVNRFKNLDGVADVTINGERRYAMRVWIDPARLAGYGLTVQDVENAIRNQNADIPAGRIESIEREFTVLSRTALGTAEEFARIVLKAGRRPAGQARRRGAASNSARADVRRESRYNGQTAISIGIVKTGGGQSAGCGARGERRILPRLNAELPEGTSVAIGFDSTVFIDRSIENVFKTILEAIGLVLVIIFLFLHSFRAALIPDRHHSGLADRHLRHHVCDGPHREHADAAGHGAGHRPRGG